MANRAASLVARAIVKVQTVTGAFTCCIIATYPSASTSAARLGSRWTVQRRTTLLGLGARIPDLKTMGTFFVWRTVVGNTTFSVFRTGFTKLAHVGERELREGKTKSQQCKLHSISMSLVFEDKVGPRVKVGPDWMTKTQGHTPDWIASVRSWRAAREPVEDRIFIPM